MKVPKEKRVHCPKCNKHTVHKVSIYKKGKENYSKRGWRRYYRKKRGYGSQPKPVQHNQCKVNKRSLPLYKCAECGRVLHGIALRLKKFEIMTK